MRNVFLIVCILSCVTVSAATILGDTYKGQASQPAYAQPANNYYGNSDFAPGSSAPKALYTTTYDIQQANSESAGPANAPGVRKGWGDTEIDTGNPSPTPLGDGWIMLLFAALAAVGIRLRTSRKEA